MLTTPLNAWHRSHNGRMVDFAGWEMPVQYSSIVHEHTAVRTAVGLFDISHMGRLTFHGNVSGHFLNFVLTNDVSVMKVGDVRYSLVCRRDGGILDDVLVYRMPDRWELVVNASNREKIVDWIRRAPDADQVGLEDRTLSTGMIAVQGPGSLSLLEAVTSMSLSGMKYYTAVDIVVDGVAAVLSRTGYTGEDGFELTVPADVTLSYWQMLMDRGQSLGIVAAGLGCRDTLRLEAAMPLYGHELNEQTDPLTAGLGFAVKLGKPDFIGREALMQIKAASLSMARVGLVLEGRRIAREEASVCANGETVGRVTSGTFSPTLQRSIAMAYLPVRLAEPGTRVDVDLRGALVPAEVVRLPFYKRSAA